LSASLTATHPELPVALASGIASVVENLLAPATPKELAHVSPIRSIEQS
jgi:hypothetical protein